jgi:hypothetical protein
VSDPESASSNGAFRFVQGDLTPFLNDEASSRAFARVAGIGHITDQVHLLRNGSVTQTCRELR